MESEFEMMKLKSEENVLEMQIKSQEEDLEEISKKQESQGKWLIAAKLTKNILNVATLAFGAV